MAKISANYEVVYIIDPAQGEEAVAATVAKFQTLAEQNATDVVVDEWGKRRLAYAIDYKTEGYYVLMYIQGPSELPRELERNFKINDKVLRYLVIRYEGELPAKREPLKPYVAREAAPAQAAEEKPAEVAVEAVEAPAQTEAPVDEEAPVSEAE